MASNGQRYSVGGVLLPRPFKIRRLGHFGFNAVRMDESREFYAGLLGFKPSDVLDFGTMPWVPKDRDLGDTRGYYYYMEQIGWDGRARPASQRRPVGATWPEALEPLSDTYVDQVFQGPLG